ncbi:integrase catalytic domain-containing protein [Thermodesulfovibrio yellowstonii]|uniref:Integrase n=1 Tax=Thermodesulfovibrio yellowstonii TaxID=28262 RepID=A0A9W6LIS8_9BACT|nr:transposase family protein [Thermodesulfovibrio islandicus]GLI52471.1 integrase [Thermodesulfovibrio islandicus]
MLTELSVILNRNRQYVGYLLRNSEKVVLKEGSLQILTDATLNEKSKRGRKKVYDVQVLNALKKIWPLSGFASSKHLVAFIRLNADLLFSHPEINPFITDRTKQLLLRISHATVDRLLKPYRDCLKLKERYKSNPYSSNLKKSIKVCCWFDKPTEPGYVEIDLVHHCGASGKGEFIYTFTATEISTGWTELRALRNKAMVWTVQALKDIVEKMPVTVEKIHSDNGSEFINAHVKKFCTLNRIDFSRSRPYRKNDAPYVESKNWSMVRAYVGWRRYDTEEELKVLDRLLKLISVRHNFFMPQMKLIGKERERGKMKKSYEIDIPINRVVKLDCVSDDKKQRLLKLRNSIDIVWLSEEIERLTEALSIAYEKKLKRLNYEKV